MGATRGSAGTQGGSRVLEPLRVELCRGEYC
ncbi:unnamed protein product [Linum tenue]|uniref:Uncharacterized protein n=1 Tax=Linum tenue TaxID=586396 RepID=A0AAV0I9S2_9ROSI|nr:unnamed protein product [Linum tenue]